MFFPTHSRSRQHKPYRYSYEFTMVLKYFWRFFLCILCKCCGVVHSHWPLSPGTWSHSHVMSTSSHRGSQNLHSPVLLLSSPDQLIRSFYPATTGTPTLSSFGDTSNNLIVTLSLPDPDYIIPSSSLTLTLTHTSHLVTPTLSQSHPSPLNNTSHLNPSHNALLS